MKSIAVMVVYSDVNRWDWTKISITSFREHFPDDPLLVVDHNHFAPERAFLASWGAIVLDNHGPTTHGGGLDAARLWCLENGYEVMVHFEPDCEVYGRRWYANLVGAIEFGYWMSGSQKMPFGPIHPCPSAWLLDKFDHTFQACLRGRDVMHDRYSEFVPFPDQLDWIDQHPPTWGWQRFWTYWWDTGMKNWFDAAVQDKAALVSCEDIRHFWYGRQRGPEEHPALLRRTALRML